MEHQKSLVVTEREASRPLADFPAGIGEDYLAHFYSSDSDPKVRETYKEKLSALKERVKELFTVTKANHVESIIFIDTLCRLGVSYHFENEIEEQMQKMFASHDFYDVIKDEQCDLYTVGLAFQTFRQFGFKLSADVFDKFQDGGGKFKEIHGADAKGILSLYEAAQWRTHGEDILDDAVSFSTSSLIELANRCSPHLAMRIRNALKHPYHKGITRIETRQYILYYEKEEMRNETLLEFAKVDFNLLQLLHREELTHVSRWYKNQRMDSNVPYARSRTVEACVWALATYFEPQYSRARITLAIAFLVLTFLDDTYDAYGTVQELELLTDAFERSLPEAPHALPDSMKYVYHVIVNFTDKVENELEKEGRSGCGYHLKNAVKMLAKGYYQETKWLSEYYIPTFDEYKENGAFSSGFYAAVAASFVGMVDVCNLSAFEWLSLRPKSLLALEINGRFMDDIAGHELEHKRKHVGTAIDCYMKQYGVSKDKATEEIRRIISDSWKDMNQELMRPHSIPFAILMRFINFARASEVYYKDHDGYTEPEYMKDYIISLFGKSFPLTM